MTKNVESYAPDVIKWASTVPFRIRIYLFGSRINGFPQEDSDLDIALEFLAQEEKQFKPKNPLSEKPETVRVTKIKQLNLNEFHKIIYNQTVGHRPKDGRSALGPLILHTTTPSYSRYTGSRTANINLH